MFIGYKDTTKISPLCIFLPKMSPYIRDFDETKYMYFLIKDDGLKYIMKLGKSQQQHQKRNW